MGHSSTPSILPNFIHTLTQTAIMSLHYLPPVKPSAIALGTFFNHGVELAVLSPLFGATYQRAKSANTKEEFVRSRRPALLPSPGAPPSSARPSRPTVSALSSTLLVLSPTRAPPTSVVSSLLPLLLPVSSSRPSARGGPSTPSVSASSPSSSRPSVSRSSSPGGVPAPTPSSN